MSTAVIDLFCGAGGLSYGLMKSGHKVKCGVDIDAFAQHAFEQNCHSRFLHADVNNITPETLNLMWGKSEIRTLAGCAPCQPFSTYSNTRKTTDDRWQLLRVFARLASGTRPEFITMENVYRLAQRPIWGEFTTFLKGLGYAVSWEIIHCQHLGIPQTRKRLVMIASRISHVRVDPLPRAHAIPMSVREAIGHLPPIEAGAKAHGDALHTASRLSPLNLERIKHSVPGGTWRDWPSHLRSHCHLKETGATYPSVYGRMDWSAPAPTITTQFFGFGNGRFGHPEQNRAISIREAAILQSFPETYSFVANAANVSFRRLGILIGNAVPPKLGSYIGDIISRSLS